MNCVKEKCVFLRLHRCCQRVPSLVPAACEGRQQHRGGRDGSLPEHPGGRARPAPWLVFGRSQNLAPGGCVKYCTRVSGCLLAVAVTTDPNACLNNFLRTQVLDSRVNWACWAISQGVISPADLAPRDNGDVRHVLPAMRSFLAQLPAPGEPRAVDPFVGCEVDVRYLAEHVLDLCNQVRRQAGDGRASHVNSRM